MDNLELSVFCYEGILKVAWRKSRHEGHKMVLQHRALGATESVGDQFFHPPVVFTSVVFISANDFNGRLILV